MTMQYTLVGSDDGASVLTVVVPGKPVAVVQSDHPNFDKIREGVMANDESVLDLIDVASAAAEKFTRLGERVTAANGRLYLDGEEVNNALAQQVVRFVAEGVEDWKPLVNFFENVQSNPNEHSREQLYDWLNAADFTITDDGLIVGYKGVRTTQDGGFVSINHGKAIVDGEVHNGAIPNHIGAIVEMPRGEVEFNPGIGCHTGLHVGTYDYASDFAQGALLEVHVNPRDVVSVPTDCNAQKMRVCRYTVVNTIDQPYSAPVLSSYDWADADAEWGDGEDDVDEQIVTVEDQLAEAGYGNEVAALDPDGLMDDHEYLEALVDLQNRIAGTDSVDPRNEPGWDGRTEDVLPEVDPKVQGAAAFSTVPFHGQPQSNGDTVQAGDRFQDLDRRRNRVIVVTQVDGDTASYETEGGLTGGSISVKRLLTPYRFTRL